MPKLPLSFVDVETTGTNAISGRIIEIGIIKVNNDQIIKEFQTLINPELRIDPFIEQMTGIKYEDLESAPLFSDVKDEVYDILDDSIFVAHNVRFDYSFVRNEFKRAGVDFKSKQFCTVKLSRLLYPRFRRHNLDSIMERFGIVNEARHRAMGDARVLWNFFKISKENIEIEKFEKALKTVLKKPTLPAGITQKMIDNLPESPGVYIFSGGNGMPLYIGKSINVRDRVLSHFVNDYGNSTDMKIAQTVKFIDAIETAGELSALLLESALIKKHKPLFNKVLRESRRMLALVKEQDNNGYNTLRVCEINQVEASEVESILGVFRSSRQVKDFLHEITKDHKLCLKIMGLEKGKGPCFNYQIGYCNGACLGEELNLKYNLRFDEAFLNYKVKPWQFSGPILIKERGNISEFHLIDKWCYLGSIRSEGDDLTNIKRDYNFDYDTYKILRRFLSKPGNQPKIETISVSLPYNT